MTEIIMNTIHLLAEAADELPATCEEMALADRAMRIMKQGIERLRRRREDCAAIERREELQYDYQDVNPIN